MIASCNYSTDSLKKRLFHLEKNNPVLNISFIEMHYPSLHLQRNVEINNCDVFADLCKFTKVFIK